MSVHAFPRVRHRPFVLRHAWNISEMREREGEAYLSQQIKIQRNTMARRGIAPDEIEREACALECAIRVELWHFVMMPEGAA